MDRLKPNNPREASLILQLIVLAGLVLAVSGILVYKAVDEGWFAPRTPLDLSDAPVLVFFNRHKGCECEMVVYEAAQEQIKNWPEEARHGMRIIHVDLDRRPDLGKQFEIIRAPALFLVDQDNRVIYSQTKSLSDAAPLDLAAFETVLQSLGK